MMIIHNPPPLPSGVCETCAGSGFDPREFYDPEPDLGRLITPCPSCDGTGQQPTEERED